MMYNLRVLPYLFAIVVGVAPPSAIIPPAVRPAAVPSTSATSQQLGSSSGQLATIIQGQTPVQRRNVFDQSKTIGASSASSESPQGLSWNVGQTIGQPGPVVGNLRFPEPLPRSSSSWMTSVGAFMFAAVVAGSWWRNKRFVSAGPLAAATELTTLDDLACGQPKLAVAALASEPTALVHKPWDPLNLARRGLDRSTSAITRNAELASRKTLSVQLEDALSKYEMADSSGNEGVYIAAEKGFAAGLIGNRSATGGEWNFDPLRISEKAPRYLPWFREAELKHGRVAMLGFLGLVGPDLFRIPGPDYCYTASIDDAVNACFGPDHNGPTFQLVLFIGLVDFLTTYPKLRDGGISIDKAGDYQLGLNFLPKDEAKAQDMKLKELQNGRLAMMAFIGALTQHQISGNGFPWLFSAEPRGIRGPGLGSSAKLAGQRFAASKASSVARHAGYKMSKAVPFLPVSPALEGYVGEEDGFDPMGFSLAIDVRWLREAELKHARVAMLATVGWIATDLGMRVPGEIFQVSTIEAHDAMVKTGAMPQMLCWLGILEVLGFLAINTSFEGLTDRKPGDFGLRTLYPKDEQGQYDMQMKELRNGRLAMLAFSGIVTSAVLTGKTFPFFATSTPSSCGAAPAVGTGSTLCGAHPGRSTRISPVTAHAKELSRSLPFLPKPQNLAGLVGEEQEFDPLGFSDTYDPRWLREAELKHGRVCMLATVGFASQQYITFPGFEPTPDALNAVYTAPVASMASLLFLAGWIESTSYKGGITMLDMFDDDRTPGDFNFGTGFLKGKSEEEIYDLKLKELNNGRLAMLAFSGMVHHNLVVKGPLFPLFPDNWVGPQGTWQLNSVMGYLGGQSIVDKGMGIV